MIITLLKSFGSSGLNLQIENNEILAFDSYDNTLKEGIDYTVDEKEKSSIKIIQANGLTTYIPPQE